MFCRIIDNKIVEASSFYGEREFDLDYKTFVSMPKNFYVYDEVLDDIVENPNFQSEQEEKAKALSIFCLQNQIDEIDKKRIRAVCEPSVKNAETGETWLEYYNGQISDLRIQIANLSN